METKKYVIIGGTSGIGLAIVKSLSQRDCKIYVGARNDRNLENIENSEFFICDVTENLYKFPEEIKHIDGLVYCPGSLTLKPLKGIKEEDIIGDFNINVFGLIRSIQYFLPKLKANQNTASVVMFSSVAVKTGMKYHTLVGATKGAIEGITRSLAAELAPKIRINAIAPSITKTPLSERFFASEKMENSLKERNPLKRFGQPDDIAEAAVYLLTESSSWVTGQIFHIDGGSSSLNIQ